MRVHINRTLQRLNCDSVLIKRDRWQQLRQDASRWRRLRPIVRANDLMVSHAGEILELLRNVDDLRSQFGQDAFVLAQLLFKKGGYFVDFGATD
ncbi:MAG: hypothetical protein ACYCUE_14540, partial [Steroidobacteraceae bacterium]